MQLSEISVAFTEATLDEIVRKAGGQRCTSWRIHDGDFTKGDSYLSELYRLTLVDDSDAERPFQVKVIVKSMPKNIGRRNTFRSTDFFRNEVNFYNVVLEELLKFQEARKPQTPFTDVSRCFAAFSDGVNDFVAMDDLGQYGFKTASRADGVDLQDCLRCMRSLGRWHALSLAMKDQEPERFHYIVKHVEETYYAARLKPWYNNFIKVQIEIAKDAIGQEYAGTELQEKVTKFFDCDLYDKMVFLTHTRNQNSVINHGDCWMPNFLFCSEAVKMIDFQLARYSSPVLDIIFFVYSCTSQALREKHYDELLATYHRSLAEMLRDLGSNPDEVFSFAELQKELQQFGRFGCGMGIESIPFSLMDESDVPDLNEIKTEEAVPIENIWILKKIKTQDGRRRLADMFLHAIGCGYLN